MTFKETEYPGLLGEIRRIAETERDPALALERIRELILIENRIPLYPGLVTLVGQSLVEEVSVSDLSPGDTVSLDADGRTLLGIVAERKGRSLLLKNAVLSEHIPQTRVDAPEKARRLNRNALETSWPSLVFQRRSGKRAAR
ncbi:MAG: hypothetical protein D6679_09205 [Candidatus Hydrogenedentota bacterium]|nr:MAG: hypothetical protein D6679_09205 [Candidatus Hydrogenedentota bacterium]